MNILLVDDSRAMRMLVMRAVRACNVGDFVFFESSSGVEALEECSRRTHDLVLTDLHMAEFDGIALIRAIKAEWPKMPCGVVTGEVHPEILDAARRAGASFIVHKPFAAEDWMAVLAPWRSRGG